MCVRGSRGGGGAGGSQGSGCSGADEFSFLIISAIVLAVIIAVLIRIFLGYAIEVGGRNFFLRLSGGERDLGYIGHAFRKDSYHDIWVTMLLRGVYIFLWTLLLIIPGIIKMYAYRMVPYILSDNPRIGHKRAIQLSEQMTMDEKFDIFVLDLSFIGWYILGVLAFGIGVLFVQPYYDAANAELYLKLREKAMSGGMTDAAELGI